MHFIQEERLTAFRGFEVSPLTPWLPDLEIHRLGLYANLDLTWLCKPDLLSAPLIFSRSLLLWQILNQVFSNFHSNPKQY